MDLGLSGKKAIVTGGSRGIGRAIAQTLTDEGASVAICARGEEGVQAAKSELEASGATVYAAAADMSDADSVRQFVAGAIEALGGVDIIVHNTSAMVGQGEEGWSSSFNIDVMAGVRAVESAMPEQLVSCACRLTRLLNSRKKEPYKNTDNCNDNKQFSLSG